MLKSSSPVNSLSNKELRVCVRNGGKKMNGKETKVIVIYGKDVRIYPLEKKEEFLLEKQELFAHW